MCLTQSLQPLLWSNHKEQCNANAASPFTVVLQLKLELERLLTCLTNVYYK